MRALEFLTGYVIFKLRYNQIYQLKTTTVADFTNVLEPLSQDPMDSCSPLDEGYVLFSAKKSYEFIKIFVNI